MNEVDRQAELRQSERREAERIDYLERTRGVEAARAFAAQTLRSYRRAVVHRAPPACSAMFRLRMIGSCRYLRRYLRT